MTLAEYFKYVLLLKGNYEARRTVTSLLYGRHTSRTCTSLPARCQRCCVLPALPRSAVSRFVLLTHVRGRSPSSHL